SVWREPDPDHRRRGHQLAPLALRTGPLERALDDRAVLADGLRGADARGPLAALAVPVGRARRGAARDPALPARDRARAAGDAALPARRAGGGPPSVRPPH